MAADRAEKRLLGADGAKRAAAAYRAKRDGTL